MPEATVLAMLDRLSPSLSDDDALKVLDTRRSGLTSSEAQRRLQTYGPNRIEQRRGESLLMSFLKHPSRRTSGCSCCPFSRLPVS